MVTSLQRVWSVADVSTDVRATLGSSSCFSAEPFVGTLVGGWGGGVITSCRRPSWRSSWSCNIQHPTSNTLLMLRCDKIEHRNLLCAHYLNQEPGLERVLRALAVHRQKASNGLTSPSRCFQKPLWNLWPQWKAQKKWLSAFGPLWHIGMCNEFLMDLHFPWRSQGFCIIILMPMYGHLIKSATLSRNLLLPFFKTNTCC